jgi:GT2 family glycosyltransferase
MKNRLAIIIVNWNQRTLTEACLSSVMPQLAKEDHIVLVDNGSKAAERPEAKADLQLTMIQSEENLGFTGGNNLGIQWAMDRQFAYLLLLNNDTEIEAGCVEKLLNSFLNTKHLGAVQPAIYWMHDKNKPWSLGGTFNKLTGMTRTILQPIPDEPVPREWLTGCAMMIPVEVLKIVGLLDERYFAYYEDVDLSFRIRNAGFQLLLVPQASVYHHAGASGKSRKKNKEGYLSPILHTYQIRNHLFLLRRHIEGVWLLPVMFFQLIKLTGYFVYFLIRFRFQKFRAVAKGLRDGLWG